MANNRREPPPETRDDDGAMEESSTSEPTDPGPTEGESTNGEPTNGEHTDAESIETVDTVDESQVHDDEPPRERPREDGNSASRPNSEPHNRETKRPDGGSLSDPGVGKGLLDEQMGPSSAMAHLYRGEIHRMKFWRERLDRTTNWAVIVMAAVLTWAFSSETNPHYVVLVGWAALTVFLVVEARRYRGYDIWRSRVRVLQESVFAVGLDPARDPPREDWRERLGADYAEPTVKITMEEAIAHRLRRIYLPLFGVVLAAWVIRVTAFAEDPWPGSAAIGGVPGLVVSLAVVAYTVALFVVACRPRTWHAREELRTRDFRKDR